MRFEITTRLPGARPSAPAGRCARVAEEFRRDEGMRFELRERAGDGGEYDLLIYPAWTTEVYVFLWPHPLVAVAIGRML